MSGYAGEALQWRLSAFDALSVHELYDVLQLRSEVFVVEQNCVFQDIDGSDAQAMHVLGQRAAGDRQLLAYARCFPAGIKFAEASIGRVVTRSDVRGSGLGHLLIEQAVSMVCSLWGTQAIRIGAQAHLAKYYRGHGFVDVGVAYIEDGIDHLEMVWQP
jgi:ElaA protein